MTTSTAAAAAIEEEQQRELQQPAFDFFDPLQDVCDNGLSWDGPEDLGPCDMSRFPSCGDEEICYNRKPSRDHHARHSADDANLVACQGQNEQALRLLLQAGADASTGCGARCLGRVVQYIDGRATTLASARERRGKEFLNPNVQYDEIMFRDWYYDLPEDAVVDHPKLILVWPPSSPEDDNNDNERDEEENWGMV